MTVAQKKKKERDETKERLYGSKAHGC